MSLNLHDYSRSGTTCSLHSEFMKQLKSLLWWRSGDEEERGREVGGWGQISCVGQTVVSVSEAVLAGEGENNCLSHAARTSRGQVAARVRVYWPTVCSKIRVHSH